MAYTSDNKWILNSEYNSALERERRAAIEKFDMEQYPYEHRDTVDGVLTGILLGEQIEQFRLALIQGNNRTIKENQRGLDIVVDFNKKIHGILADSYLRREEKARVYQILSRILYNHLMELHPEKLTPDEVAIISDSLAVADTDIANHDYEAAIGIYQLQIHSASELMARIILLSDS